MRSVLFSFVVLSLINVVSVFWFGDSDNNDDENVGTVIGIDLGTTYSCVGVFRNGRVEIIANDQGNRITPSYVAFDAEERMVGESARNQMISNPENTIYDVKRLIGRTWDDENVQKDIKFYSFKVVNMANKPHVQAQVKGQTKTFTPEEISAMVLGKMRDIAQDYLGKKVTHAVVTVPAYFNNGQRQATRDAGTIAGLKVMKIINEPTAAAIAYGLYNREGVKNILVFDLGGGTFDVSLLTINNGNFKVRATNGDTHLGGEDFDMRVIEHFIALYKKKTGKDIRSHSKRAVQKLRREVEKAKRVLSSQLQARVEVDSIMDSQDFSEVLTRAKFEELNMDLFRSTVQPLKQVLEDAGVGKEEVNDIVLVGGSTRIPKIQQLVKDFFNGKDPSRDINPDEAVAYGAAVQAGMLSGEEETGELVLWDVNPLSLGIRTVDEIMSWVIPRNTILPTKKNRGFTTVYDNQVNVEFAVYEGERTMAEDNHFLGQFVLTGVTPLPRGVASINVTFEIDNDGILHVTAEEKSTGNKNGIVIDTDRNALSQQEIARMIQDAETFAEQDQKAKERVDAKNKLELYLYTLKSQVSDQDRLGGKLSERDKSKVMESVEDATLWMEAHRNADTEQLKQKQKEVESVVHPIVKHLYGWRDEF